MTLGMIEPITAAGLLTAWERGYGQSLVECGLQLLSLALPDAERGVLASLSIGERNRVLILLRTRLFGPTASCVDHCPACGAGLELEFPLNAFIPARSTTAETISATWSAHRLTMRLPTSTDLGEIQSLPEGSPRHRALLGRCLLNEHEVPPPDEWPDELIERIGAKLSAADPCAETGVPLACTDCGQAWRRRFDIVAFLWSEIDRYARRLVAEVHLLASAYGWSEREVLELSPWRRSIYLGLVRQ
jgi:hypothetical protein